MIQDLIRIIAAFACGVLVGGYGLFRLYAMALATDPEVRANLRASLDVADDADRRATWRVK